MDSSSNLAMNPYRYQFYYLLLNMVFLRILPLLLLLTPCASAQQTQAPVPDSAKEGSYQQAVAWFYEEAGLDAHLFTGINYPNYDPVIKGNPFFKSDQMMVGSIFYDGTLYPETELQYDIVSQKILVNRYHEHFRISLLNDKIAWFSVAGHHFENLQSGQGHPESTAKGFFDILVRGKVSLLALRTKKIQKGLHPEDPITFVEEDLYYIRAGNNLFPLTGKASILDALSDRRAALKTFIRKHHFRFKKSKKEEEFKKTVTHYLILTP
jgi:hypothetical protein